MVEYTLDRCLFSWHLTLWNLSDPGRSQLSSFTLPSCLWFNGYVPVLWTAVGGCLGHWLPSTASHLGMKSKWRSLREDSMYRHLWGKHIIVDLKKVNPGGFKVSHYNSQSDGWRPWGPGRLNGLSKVTQGEAWLAGQVAPLTNSNQCPWCNGSLSILFATANASEAHGGRSLWAAAVLYHASFKNGFFILTPCPRSTPCSTSCTIAAWVRAVKSMLPAHSSKSLSLMAMPFPSHSRSQPSPSGWAVKIFSGCEPPSQTSSLFFKPRHQCCVHMHMSHEFFYSFHFQHRFCFQEVKGLFRVHESLRTQWHFILSSLPWDFFIFCRWSWVEKWLLNPAYSRGWLKLRSPWSLPTSTFVKILHNYWKQFKRSCLWSIKQDFF